MTPHIEQESCLKEKEWREVHDFISSTKPYRTSLDDSILGIKKSIGEVAKGMWGVALVVLVPFITSMIWIGGIGAKVEQHGEDIVEIKQEIKELKRG